MVMGSTTIHEDVFREIARLVLDDTEGIYSYEPKNPLAPLLGEKSVKPVIIIKWPAVDDENQERIAYEIRLAALYGASIPQMVSGIREKLAEKVNAFTGYDVSAIDIYITKLIQFENDRSVSENDSKPYSEDKDERSVGSGS
jgi:uncharacterized alkaline shock family protein YloU